MSFLKFFVIDRLATALVTSGCDGFVMASVRDGAMVSRQRGSGWQLRGVRNRWSLAAARGIRDIGAQAAAWRVRNGGTRTMVSVRRIQRLGIQEIFFFFKC